MAIHRWRPCAALVALLVLLATSGCSGISSCGCIQSLPADCVPETTTITWSNVDHRVDLVYTYQHLVVEYPEAGVQAPDQGPVYPGLPVIGLQWIRMDHATWDPVLAASLGEHLGVPVRIDRPADTAKDAGKGLKYDPDVPAYITYDALKLVTADFTLSCGDYSEGTFTAWTEKRSGVHACGSPITDDYVAEADWGCPPRAESPTPTWTSMPGKKDAGAGTTPPTRPPG
ncbi:hypothetical protein KZ829_24115 [Actinoplanes hulinensis]|uniref:Lipoprotein n=1 Tax=Actinoplanes hulinensis TaxID=1144547 RepID=A0ABS7B826_9ACTN|nr:hypothetical protein [Actinoplanes hulinensis]MBW6436834.1 hypothetical protein [Actinoplanes hulinensis]